MLFVSGAEHVPVLLKESVELLNPKPGGIYVDCTLGAGGHTKEILSVPGTKVVAFDVDDKALSIAKEMLSVFERSGRLHVEWGSYVYLEDTLKSLGINKVDGVIADLGVSSIQIDDPARGFSFRFDSPLDMRMNPKSSLTAWKVVNEYPLEELERILREYGEEPFARRIAREIVKNRPINTTKELVKVISKAIPPNQRRKRRRHFATKTFQAIRIEVNRELENIERLLEILPRVLKSGGRAVFITFHSLEDRMVKRFFKSSKDFKVITKKPIVPSEKEISENPRARSAKLRAAERI